MYAFTIWLSTVAKSINTCDDTLRIITVKRVCIYDNSKPEVRRYNTTKGLTCK